LLSIKLETTAAVAAFGIEAAADDDVELEAAAADGNAVLDAGAGCTTFGCFEAGIAKSRKDNAQQ
jgi:predicted RNA methylase